MVSHMTWTFCSISVFPSKCPNLSTLSSSSSDFSLTWLSPLVRLPSKFSYLADWIIYFKIFIWLFSNFVYIKLPLHSLMLICIHFNFVHVFINVLFGLMYCSFNHDFELFIQIHPLASFWCISVELWPVNFRRPMLTFHPSIFHMVDLLIITKSFFESFILIDSLFLFLIYSLVPLCMCILKYDLDPSFFYSKSLKSPNMSTWELQVLFWYFLFCSNNSQSPVSAAYTHEYGYCAIHQGMGSLPVATSPKKCDFLSTSYYELLIVYQ